MEDIIQRISDIYNDCWKSYKQYLADNNMAAYNKRSKELMEKYSCKSDITDLLLWFAGKVNALHEIYMGGEGYVNHS